MLEDRVAIVTGAGQGIGRAIAVELAKAGAHVVASGRRLEPVEAVAGEVRALGRRSLALSCDVRDSAQVESLEARPDSRFRLRVTASGFDSEWSWRLEPVAGGTKVIHAATFEPFDRWTGILVRLGRASLASRVEAHLRVLKERAEAAQRASNPAT